MKAKDFDALFRNLTIPMLACSADDLTITYMNPEASVLLEKNDAAGEPLWSVISCPDERIKTHFMHELWSKKYVRGMAINIKDKSDATRRLTFRGNEYFDRETWTKYYCIYLMEEAPLVDGEEGIARAIDDESIDRLLLDIVINSYDAHNVDFTVNNILAVAGNFAQVSRVYLFEHTEPGFCSNTYEWCADGVKPQMDSNQNLDTRYLNLKRVMDSNYIANDVSDLPYQDRSFLQAQGVKSLMMMPLTGPDGMFGFVGFDQCDRIRSWTHREIRLLKDITYLISPMLLRKQAMIDKNKVFETLSTVLDNVELPVYVSDTTTHEVLFANKFARREFGEGEDDHPAGQTCWQLMHSGQDQPCAWCPLPKMLDSYSQGDERATRYQYEFQNTKNDRWYMITDYIIDWIDGRKVHMETAFDITDMKTKEKQLQHFASIDVMTGAYNREWGFRVLKETIEHAVDDNLVSCLCFIDLDGLKLVNDRFGHDAGDSLISGLTTSIKKFSRGGDILTRWGGDEFILCLYDCEYDQAEKVIKKMQTEFDELGTERQKPYNHRFSYGIVEIKPNGRKINLERLISIADYEMYEQKKAKKSSLVIIKESLSEEPNPGVPPQTPLGTQSPDPVL